MHGVTRQGLRFIWPYQASSTITVSRSTGLLCLTDEFILRVGNIRSHVLTTDFLAKYPEFEGEAPRLEPSPTFHTPGNVNYLEALYWKLLKEKPRDKSYGRALRRNRSSSPSNDSDSTVSTSENSPRIAPTLQNLLNPSSPGPI